MSLLEAALKYAAAGIRVFPVRGKSPAVSSWKEDATISPEVVASLFTNATGIGGVIPDGVVILDIDDGGMESLKKNGFDAPDTLVATTKRGEHRWYKHDGEFSSRKIGVLPKVDILVNGYVVLPPSPPAYAWEEDFDLGKITPAPPWMMTITRQEEGRKAGVPVEEFFEGLPYGEHQTGLFRYACHLRSRPKQQLIEAKILVTAMAKKCGWAGPDDPSTIAERVWKTYDAATQEEEQQVHKVWSMADLYSANFPTDIDLVQDLLPSVGYTVLSSPPKKGKSLVAAYVATCVASGLPVWGRPVDQCGVFYLDLEQEDFKAVGRWKTINDSLGIRRPPAGLHTAFTWDRMDNRGVEKIGDFLSDHPHVRLVVVDTLADIYPLDGGGEGGGNAYYREQRVVAKLAPLARDYGCALLVVHHDRKGSDGDMIARASGTYAITGKAKAVWSFQRKGDTAVLEATGKNISDSEIHLRLNRSQLLWHEYVPQNP